jgi:hypothetical protein
MCEARRVVPPRGSAPPSSLPPSPGALDGARRGYQIGPGSLGRAADHSNYAAGPPGGPSMRWSLTRSSPSDDGHDHRWRDDPDRRRGFRASSIDSPPRIIGHKSGTTEHHQRRQVMSNGGKLLAGHRVDRSHSSWSIRPQTGSGFKSLPGSRTQCSREAAEALPLAAAGCRRPASHSH